MLKVIRTLLLVVLLGVAVFAGMIPVHASGAAPAVTEPERPAILTL